jgi:basic membrane protein A
MKKTLAILLALLMGLTVLVGCSGEEAAQSSDKTVYNVAYVVNGNLGDKSFFDSAEAGLEELLAAGRITLNTIEMGGTEEDQASWLPTLYEVADSGEYDIIICGTYQMPDYLKEVATAYPDQKFAIYDDSTYVGQSPNVVNITYRQNDMGYLIGVFAASMTSQTSVANINDKKVVGFVGGMDSPVINDFLYGFLKGVQDTDPEVKVDTRYVNSYVDTATAKEMALSMINDNGADIIWGVAGLSGNGAAEAAAETGKAWFIGVDSDQELTLPADQRAVCLTSGLKNVGNSLVWLIDELDAGREHWGTEVNLGLNEGGVGIVTDKNFAAIAPQAVQDAVKAAQEAVASGKIVVPSAIGDTTKGAETLRDSMMP